MFFLPILIMAAVFHCKCRNISATALAIDGNDGESLMIEDRSLSFKSLWNIRIINIHDFNDFNKVMLETFYFRSTMHLSIEINTTLIKYSDKIVLQQKNICKNFFQTIYFCIFFKKQHICVWFICVSHSKIKSKIFLMTYSTIIQYFKIIFPLFFS